ncbi:DAK2 domain-containing protein [Aeromicrobium phragmitis]|uniref:DAK2 domain-containing protein n=1 Tax=Aeromicrobium phragmitis TaxID=2478914 RepID=A0A3L8PLA3_9ACTN|nr:DAK2 domain-containing protein [Aeromicrobium phragmitis]RLV54852.1 DAK2 domain-containing protein [Aeromicrobium phragmitis]
MPLTIEASRFRDWARGCAQALAAARAEIDAMNVFPVPDSDTGTNAYLTVQSGYQAVDAAADEEGTEALVRAFVVGVLTGAQGNSGVILAELLRGCLRVLRRCEVIGPEDVVEALGAATAAAYAAVQDPQEGTILTVAAAATEGARAAAMEGRSARYVFEAAADAARVALARTPSQMERLARAGVVDAGGRALVVLLDATAQALTGRIPPPAPSHVPVPLAEPGTDLVEDGPGYEVMYLLDAADEAVPGLRKALAPLGDSLVVIGGDGLWNVHVHVDDVGAAIEAGIAAGRPYRIQVTHFAAHRRGAHRPGTQRVVVSAVTGTGLADLTRDSGAVAVEFSAGHPLTIEEMSAALRSVDAEEVIVLPNRFGHVRPFEAAAKQLRDDGVRVAVLPTQAQVQALAALAVHDPGRTFDDDVVAMSAAAAHAKHGALTVATESGITMAGPCERGDVLGVVNGDFAVIGDDQAQVAREILARLDAGGAEMVTLVTGAECPAGLADDLCRWLALEQPHVDVVVHDGGQEKYTLFLAVE